MIEQAGKVFVDSDVFEAWKEQHRQRVLKKERELGDENGSVHLLPLDKVKSLTGHYVPNLIYKFVRRNGVDKLSQFQVNIDGREYLVKERLPDQPHVAFSVMLLLAQANGVQHLNPGTCWVVIFIAMSLALYALSQSTPAPPDVLYFNIIPDSPAGIGGFQRDINRFQSRSFAHGRQPVFYLEYAGPEWPVDLPSARKLIQVDVETGEVQVQGQATYEWLERYFQEERDRFRNRIKTSNSHRSATPEAPIANVHDYLAQLAIDKQIMVFTERPDFKTWLIGQWAAQTDVVRPLKSGNLPEFTKRSDDRRRALQIVSNIRNALILKNLQALSRKRVAIAAFLAPAQHAVSTALAKEGLTIEHVNHAALLGDPLIFSNGDADRTAYIHSAGWTLLFSIARERIAQGLVDFDLRNNYVVRPLIRGVLDRMGTRRIQSLVSGWQKTKARDWIAQYGSEHERRLFGRTPSALPIEKNVNMKLKAEFETLSAA
jgi:hypothetical protein